MRWRGSRGGLVASPQATPRRRNAGRYGGRVSEQLVDSIRQDLRDIADPERAPGQQAYMKSLMPFLGVRVPDARRVATQAAKGRDAATLLTAATVLWDQAEHREERYAAMALLSSRVLRGDG